MSNRTATGELLGEFRKSLIETYLPPSPFPDPETERTFLSSFGQRFAPLRRAAIGLGLGIWVVFLWWDFYHYWTVPEIFTLAVLENILVPRFIGVLILLAALIVSLSRQFRIERYAHHVLSLTILACKLCIIAMIAIVPQPMNYVYYFVGLYLILMFQFGFVHLRARPALRVTLAGIAALLVCQFIASLQTGFTFLRPEHFRPAMFYYLSVCAIGFGLCVKFERYARQQYDSELRMSAANRELQRQNLLIEQSRADSLAKSEALLWAKEEQRTRAIHSNEEKSRFLAAAAHDLRQPMFGLSLSLAALQDSLDDQDISGFRRSVEVCQKTVRGMVQSFNTILDLSRLEAGQVRPEYGAVDLTHLFEEVEEELAPFARAKNVVLRCASRRGVLVHSDRAMLGRILKNLISNGIKYANYQAASPPTVVVRAVRLHSHVRIDVIDNGVGIPAAQWKSVFEPFVQLDNKGHLQENGLGLGLSIVNAMVSVLDQHRLEMKSRVGQGTRFSIDVPNGVRESADTATLAAADGAPLSHLPGSYVLLIEDDERVRCALHELFVRWGILVDAAADIDELSAVLEETERIPDLVVTDYRLPKGKTAFDVAAMTRAAFGFKRNAMKVPLLLISAEWNSVELYKNLGADACLRKPVHTEELKSVMQKLITGFRQCRRDAETSSEG